MWKQTQQTTSSHLTGTAEKALQDLLQRKDIGFFDFAILEKGLKASQELAQKYSPRYEQIAILGIGGSCLGTQALVESLAPELLDQHKILFFDNVDGKSFYRKLKLCKEKTLWVIISKSGNTLETLSQVDYVSEHLQKNNQPSISQNAVVITENKSNPLSDWANKHKIEILEIPLSVGGRFSVLTPVGLFPAAFLGLPAEAILSGAKKTLQNQKFVTELVAQFLSSFERGELTTYFFYYCDDLKFWGAWLQQLWAESLGKPQAELSVPYACRGSTDQHSVLQQIAQGPQKKFVCFLRVKESETFGAKLSQSGFFPTMQGKGLGQLLGAEAQATQQALGEAHIHSCTLQAESLSGESVGSLLFTFELVVASLGMAYKLNPFDQPGVERGKVLTHSLLKA